MVIEDDKKIKIKKDKKKKRKKDKKGKKDKKRIFKFFEKENLEIYAFDCYTANPIQAIIDLEGKKREAYERYKDFYLVNGRNSKEYIEEEFSRKIDIKKDIEVGELSKIVKNKNIDYEKFVRDFNEEINFINQLLNENYGNNKDYPSIKTINKTEFKNEHKNLIKNLVKFMSLLEKSRIYIGIYEAFYNEENIEYIKKMREEGKEVFLGDLPRFNDTRTEILDKLSEMRCYLDRIEFKNCDNNKKFIPRLLIKKLGNLVMKYKLFKPSRSSIENEYFTQKEGGNLLCFINYVVENYLKHHIDKFLNDKNSEAIFTGLIKEFLNKNKNKIKKIKIKSK